jgi:hypothetical protein
VCVARLAALSIDPGPHRSTKDPSVSAPLKTRGLYPLRDVPLLIVGSPRRTTCILRSTRQYLVVTALLKDIGMTKPNHSCGSVGLVPTQNTSARLHPLVLRAQPLSLGLAGDPRLHPADICDGSSAHARPLVSVNTEATRREHSRRTRVPDDVDFMGSHPYFLRGRTRSKRTRRDPHHPCRTQRFGAHRTPLELWAKGQASSRDEQSAAHHHKRC